MWDGFSEEDITKMRSGLDVADTCHSSHKNYTDVGASHNGKRKPTLGSVRKITEDGLTKNGTKQKENATPDLQLRELTSQEKANS